MLFFSDVDTNKSVQSPQGSKEETEKIVAEILECVINRVVQSDESIAAKKIVEH